MVELNFQLGKLSITIVLPGVRDSFILSMKKTEAEEGSSNVWSDSLKC